MDKKNFYCRQMFIILGLKNLSNSFNKYHFLVSQSSLSNLLKL
uniref:Uncharacterized protein n=1 Tax=Heterorhabditis bacteriophora TaxID=37862 RepID=A0A1I7W858_HETBA